ncbi:MAG: CAP domain-containing protein [Thermoguttaceae bacterium]|nr:CAP domain-containing protein [Thermoguttaceae bacterium]
MKRTTMFILALALASIISETAYAQYYYWPWFGGYSYSTQCANGQCQRKQAPAPATPNPSLTPPKEPADETPTLNAQEIKPFCLRVIELVNAHRKALGLPALQVDSTLCTGCDSHSVWMARNGFQHAYGIGGRECIAYGVRSPEAVVNMWLNSSGHRAILLGSGRIVGVGCNGTFWTLRVR